ncbi:acyl-CoA dehydrogenase family protein [Noviherbaspirillum saxi]|uniref:Acyl-CoA dehydrogenase n=1 Tax=Noviherbaspirillum saxi TaxID=2320863 RepID=A0A3A3FJQ6_9BURK|nr:acyl-CoA dehydrogenase [Noviherbaspirillum saxi]RJF91712.1 acyl-CoA dehydrogenase [Noviherbaspirillum saxi]
MDFQLTQEQQMLKDSARRFLEDNCAFEARGSVIGNGGFDVGHWNTFAELGWLGMSLPEEYGGLGGSAIETALLMEEFGRVLCIEPYWAVAVLAAQTIVASGDQDKAGSILPALVAGEACPVVAHGEPDARGMLSYVTTSAVPAGPGNWTLKGNKSMVIGGNVADRFIVSARTSGAPSDQTGITLFLVDRSVPGVKLHDVRLIDNRWCADIDLADVQVAEADVLGTVGGGYAALDTGHAHATVGLCAEAVGVMEKALWITRDYLKTRKQFGVTLSSFQALQHRMSEMLIELELSRGMVHKALSTMNASPEVRQLALSAAKVHVGRSGKFVCGQSIQLHGGIGVTEEYVIGHHFKRMTTIEYALGSSHFHLEQLAAMERKRVA